MRSSFEQVRTRGGRRLPGLVVLGRVRAVLGVALDRVIGAGREEDVVAADRALVQPLLLQAIVVPAPQLLDPVEEVHDATLLLLPSADKRPRPPRSARGHGGRATR